MGEASWWCKVTLESGRPVMARVPAKFSEIARIAEIRGNVVVTLFSGVSLIAEMTPLPTGEQG